jgi:protein-L-isoaspartate(D-aspartate) O-methyltransferase
LTGIEERRKLLDAAMDQRGCWPERSPWIRDAVEAVPRHLFAPDRLWRWDGHRYVPVDREESEDRWAAEIYDHLGGAAITRVTEGRATSSLSAPIVVTDMLDALLLDPGHRVLELGTGAGWNAALLARRTGPGLVHSVEVEPELCGAARARLEATGAEAASHVGDGTDGWPDAAPYDRIEATYAVEEIPWAWVAQARPGGRIVTPWGLLGHVALTVADDGRSAAGRMRGLAAFMPTSGSEPRLTWGQVREDRPPETESSSPGLDVRQLHEDANLLFACRVALPDVQIATARSGSGPDHRGGKVGEVQEITAWMNDGRSSWAKVVARASEPALAYQAGPRRLLEEVRAAERWWHGLDRPSLYDFGITVERDRQFVWCRDEANGPLAVAC